MPEECTACPDSSTSTKESQLMDMSVEEDWNKENGPFYAQDQVNIQYQVKIDTFGI